MVVELPPNCPRHCQRGHLGAAPGTCVGSNDDGLWLNDASGHVYCGQCWDEFELLADAMIDVATQLPRCEAPPAAEPPVHQAPPAAEPAVHQPPPVAEPSVQPDLPAAEPFLASLAQPEPERSGLWASCCERHPPEACQGNFGDMLFRDEEGGGIFCDSCWAEFTSQGLVDKVGPAWRPTSSPKSAPTAAPRSASTSAPTVAPTSAPKRRRSSGRR